MPHKYSEELDQMCQDFLSLVEGQVEKDVWRPLYEKGDAQVYHSKLSKTRYRIQGDLDNTPETCFDLLADAQERPKYDDMCESGDIIESLDKDTAIIYSKMKGIWPSAPRDVVLLSHVRDLGNGKYICINKSVEHPDCPDYQSSKGYIRVQCDLAGTLCIPSENDSTKCRVLQIADGDLRGNIPKWLLTFIATIGLPKSFRKLNSIVKELQVTYSSKYFSTYVTSPMLSAAPSRTSFTKSSSLKILESRIENLEVAINRQTWIFVSLLIGLFSAVIIKLQ